MLEIQPYRLTRGQGQTAKKKKLTTCSGQFGIKNYLPAIEDGEDNHAMQVHITNIKAQATKTQINKIPP